MLPTGVCILAGKIYNEKLVSILPVVLRVVKAYIQTLHKISSFQDLPTQYGVKPWSQP
jgi:hypothetical protein